MFLSHGPRCGRLESVGDRQEVSDVGLRGGMIRLFEPGGEMIADGSSDAATDWIG